MVFPLSHKRIYIYIYSPKRKLCHLLLRRPNGRQTRNVGRFSYRGTDKNIPNRVDIDLRMEEANKRIEIGYFEADTIESRRIRGQQSSCLTVMVVRLSRKTIIKKTASKTSNMTSTSIIRAMKPYRNTVKSKHMIMDVSSLNMKKLTKRLTLNRIFLRHIKAMKNEQILI